MNNTYPSLVEASNFANDLSTELLQMNMNLKLQLGFGNVSGGR